MQHHSLLEIKQYATSHHRRDWFLGQSRNRDTGRG
jgi:hypothetical protein